MYSINWGCPPHIPRISALPVKKPASVALPMGNARCGPPQPSCRIRFSDRHAPVGGIDESRSARPRPLSHGISAGSWLVDPSRAFRCVKSEVNMALVFDHAPVRWREMAFFAASKSLWDEYRKYRDQETKCEDHGREAEDHGLEAMAHWHDPRPSPCVRRGGRRHLLDDNPCSG